MSRSPLAPLGSATRGYHLLNAGLAIAAAAALVGSVAWAFSSNDAPPKAAQAAEAAQAAPAAPQAQPVQTAAAPQATPATPRVATAAPSTASAPAALPGYADAGQRVSIDPKTGAVLPVEHDDAAALAAAASAQKRSARSIASAPQQLVSETGAIGVVVPEDLQTYTVATRAANGTVTVEHATGPVTARKRMKASNQKAPKGLVQNKEERNDR